jgi:uncharacterized protein YjiS (DUF1127 family)
MNVSSKLRRWRQARRYRTTVRELRALPPRDLRALGIPPAEIDRLACAASRF